MDVEVLVFRVAERLYGVRAASVVEVLQAATLSVFPDQPAAIEGLLNLRGSLVPVLSMGRLLHKRAAAMQHHDHLIVVRVASNTAALLVDRAIDLICIHPDQQFAEQPALDEPDRDEPDAGKVGQGKVGQGKADRGKAGQGDASGRAEADFVWIDLIARTPRGVVHVLDAEELLSQPPFAALVHLVATRSASQEVGE